MFVLQTGEQKNIFPKGSMYFNMTENCKLRKAILYYPHFTTFRNETSEYY
jgi:hypothetical protein